MSESGYYPVGAEYDPKAPWNEIELPEEEVEVTVSITLSKTFKLKVSDYKVEYEKDENGEVSKNVDYTECDFAKAIKQVILPYQAWKYVDTNTKIGPKAISDLKGWIVDEIEVIE